MYQYAYRINDRAETWKYRCVGYANVWCLPLSFKLKRQVQHDQLFKSMVLEGVVGIQSGMAPGALRGRLAVYAEH